MLARPNRCPHADRPDVFERLAPWWVAFCLAAGAGWLLHSAGDGHIHVTGDGLERHHHAYVGAHEHPHAHEHSHPHDHAHDDGHDDGHDHVDARHADHRHEHGEPEDSDGDETSQSGFFGAATPAEAAPEPATGLPTDSCLTRRATAATARPPTLDLATDARPRAPPARRIAASENTAVVAATRGA